MPRQSQPHTASGNFEQQPACFSIKNPKLKTSEFLISNKLQNPDQNDLQKQISNRNRTEHVSQTYAKLRLRIWVC